MNSLKKIVLILCVTLPICSCKVTSYDDHTEELYDFFVVDNHVIEFRCIGDIDEYQISGEIYNRYGEWQCFENEVVLYDSGRKGLLIFPVSFRYGYNIKIKLHGAYGDKYYTLYCN